MPKAVAPIDMLRKCREEFAKQAETFDAVARIAGTVWERNAAKEMGSTAHQFMDEIDATFRDWV